MNSEKIWMALHHCHVYCSVLAPKQNNQLVYFLYVRVCRFSIRFVLLEIFEKNQDIIAHTEDGVCYCKLFPYHKCSFFIYLFTPIFFLLLFRGDVFLSTDNVHFVLVQHIT